MAVRQNMEQFSKKIEKWSKLFPKEVAESFGNVRTMLVTDIRSNYLSGQVLNVVTGKLRASIEGIIKKTPPVSLSVGTDVKSSKGFGYGAYWFHRGRDFLTPSIKKNLTRIEKMILENIMKSYEKGAI